jgi:hypothetical protein
MRNRVLTGIGIATACVAIAAPSALAMRASQDDAGAIGSTSNVSAQTYSFSSDAVQDARHAALGRLGVGHAAVDTSDVFTRYVKNHQPAAVDTSDVFTRYVKNHQPVTIPYVSHGIGVDASRFGGATAGSESSSVAAGKGGSGFDWTDASIGAGGAAGLLLLMSIGVALGKRNRESALAG